MPSRVNLRLIPLILALALVLAPVSVASATPWSFGAPAAQAADDGGFFSWIAGWFQDLLDDSDPATTQVDGVDGLGIEAPQPTNGLTNDEEKESGPSINIEGNK